MNKENGIKRLNRLSVQAKEYRDENTQVVKLSQAIEVIELLDEPKPLTEDQAWKVIADVYNQDGDRWREAKDQYVDSLKEKEKPIVPQFVADYIEICRTKKFSFKAYVKFSLDSASPVSDFKKAQEWNKDNLEVAVRAWLDGYEVEKEKLFHMPVPYQKSDQVYYCGVGNNITTKWSADKYWHHQYTQEELDKYFPDIKHMAEEVRNE